MAADENFLPRRFIYEFAVHYRHFERYMYALQLLGKIGKHETWLDCACGSGYGSHLLSGFAETVIGYDIKLEAVDYANTQYSHSGCVFYSDLERFASIQFDVVISVETIEHMPRSAAVPFLTRIKQQMKKEAVLVITTPLVRVSNPNPANPYHQYEYSYNDFLIVLQDAGFEVNDFLTNTVQFTDGETKEQGYFRCVIA